MLPPAEEPELAEFLKTWKPRHPIDPRADMETDVMDIISVTALFSDLTEVELTTLGRAWAGSCRTPTDTSLVFHEIDVARVRLIHDLRHDMDIGEDAIPLVLSLLDQVYDLRSRMNAVLTRGGRAAAGRPDGRARRDSAALILDGRLPAGLSVQPQSGPGVSWKPARSV